MFGIGGKKEKQPLEVKTEQEQPKAPPYDINSEVVFHIMPTRFKKQNADAKKAQKTGLVIVLSASALIIVLASALAWYFLIYSKKDNKQVNLPVAQSETVTPEGVSSSAENSAVVSSSSATLEPTVIENPIIASSSENVGTSSEVASTSVATSTDTATLNPEPSIIASSTDTDGDGLTDAEEAVFGSNKDKADSDADGFSDLAELEKGYNPAGTGKIAQTKLMGNFINNNFSISYPTQWQFTSSGNDSVIFNAPNQQMIKISLQPNLKNQTILGWYKEQFGNQEVDSSQYLYQVDAGGNALWQGIFSPNGLSIYLTDETKQTIVSLNYDPGFTGRLDFKQLFLLMVNSFRLKN